MICGVIEQSGRFLLQLTLIKEFSEQSFGKRTIVHFQNFLKFNFLDQIKW